jgi:hypothetical protein
VTNPTEAWAAIVDSDAVRVDAAKAGTSGVLAKKLPLIAAAMRAIALDQDYNTDGVFRQRNKLTIVVSMLATPHADQLKAILDKLSLASMLTVNQTYYSGKSSIEIALRPPLLTREA